MIRALLVLGLCAAVVVGGCGGGSDDTSTSSTPQEDTTAEAPQGSQQDTTSSPTSQGEKSKQDKSSSSNGASQKQSNDSKQSNASNPHRTKVPRISSAPAAGSHKPAPGVKTVKNGDNSVQEYGVESDASERRKASIALQAYLNARADEDWGAACSLLAAKPMEQLERLRAAAAKQGKKLNGCPGTMALLREREAQANQDTRITEVLSLRGGGDISGDPSYLIYVGAPGKTLLSMPMYLQEGTWKVGLATAAELPVG